VNSQELFQMHPAEKCSQGFPSAAGKVAGLPSGRSRGRSSLVLIPALLLPAVLEAQQPAPAPQFLRGDANLDGRITIADVLTILHYMHRGQPLRCLDAADSDDSGTITTNDYLLLLRHIFRRHSGPKPPYPKMGIDPTDDDPLDCKQGLPVPPPASPEAIVRGIEAERPLCWRQDAGADADFISFQGTGQETPEVHVFPGQPLVRLPVLITTLGAVDALTLSLYAPPSDLILHRIDFSGSYLDRHRASLSWSSHFTQLQGLGYLASSFVLDLEVGSRNQAQSPGVWAHVLAYVEVSVPASARPGTLTQISFDETPGLDGGPSIPNELVRQGSTESLRLCGLRVKIVPETELFLRGDVNRDWRINIADAVEILRLLFARRPPLPCLEAADFNDDGVLGADDVIRLLTFIFVSGPPPLPPYPNPGKDPEDSPGYLGCMAEER
jgi:hypothetical protein